MMEAARTSETLVQLYQTTRRYNPEDSHLHTHRRENLKSYFLPLLCSTLDGDSFYICSVPIIKDHIPPCENLTVLLHFL
jgi:hypothetical protein